MVFARIAGSSASGMPALTSSMWAPASTWASVSRSTRQKSPAFISSARSLRPVGLMRSPMMTNGWSSPMTTSRVAELTTVRVTRRGLPWVSSRAGGKTGPPSHAAGLDELGEAVLVVLGLDALDLGGDLGVDVRAAGLCVAAPLPDVVVVGALAGAAGGLVDGDLEPRVEHDLALLAAVAGGDLGRDVAPPDHRHHRHGVRALLVRQQGG